MDKKDALKYFDTNPKKSATRMIAEALGISTQYVSQWPQLVPEGMAARLEKLTDGELEYRLEDYVK